MIADRITQAATLHRYTAAAKNELGDKTGTFVDVPVFVEIQQQTATENRAGQNVAVSTWLAFFRPDVVLAAADQLTVDGKRYTFDGDPWLVRHPRLGRASHWVARMRKVN